MGQKIYESDKFLKTGGTSSQYLMADGTTSTGPTGGVDVGTGTANKVAKFSDSDTITDSTITDDGTDVSITGKLGIQTAAPDSLIHIEHEDNNYDVARGIHLDYTKDHTGTGWSASIFGIRSTITHEGSGKTTDVTAGRFQALHEGTGTAYFLYGSSSRGTHNGSGDTGVIWGAFNQGHISGTGTGTHPYLIGTNQKAELDNANASVGEMQGIVSIAKTNAGAITNRIVAGEFVLDCNQGAATAVDASVLHLESLMGNLTVSGNARTINSVSTLPSVFAGTMETTSFIKTGGTSSQFLKADGSVDSNTYLTGSLPTDFVSAASGGTFGGDVTVDASARITSRLAVGGDFAPQKVLHLKNAAPVFRFEDSDITGGHLDMIKSSRNMRFDLEQDDATTATNFNFRIGGTTHLYMKNNFVGIMNDAPTEALDVTGDVLADGFKVPGGLSTRFLKADGSTDSNTYSTTDTQLTTEQVQDIVGAMVSSNTEQSISVTYSDNDGKLNFDAGAATYTHPGETAFTAAVDTGALTGAVVVSDIDMNITTNAFGHVEDAAMAVATRTLTLADLGFTGDLDATNDQVLPSDFVSAASGGSFGGGIVADSFTITGLSSGDSFLKADGSLDGTVYLSGAGTSGNIPIYDSANVLTDNADLSFNFITSKVTMGADLDVVGNITTDIIQADGWTYIPQTFQANFVHSTNNGYMNLPFNSLSDASSGGEQHFIVTPYQGYVHSVAFKNTATGNTMTATNMNFRILVNGTLSHTSNTQTFTAAQRTYKGWVMGSTDAMFNSGDDLRFQFRCTSGFWQDTCAVVVLKAII